MVTDLLEVRFLLEPPIAAMAATHADAKDIKKITALCDEVERLLRFVETTGGTLQKETIETHREIADAIASHIVFTHFLTVRLIIISPSDLSHKRALS